MCVLTGYEDAAHEHDTRAGRENHASGKNNIFMFFFSKLRGIFG
jgi:hypothetical protein